MKAGQDPALQAEAQARWGDTEAFKESTRRAKSYSDADWAKIKGEIESIEVAFAEALDEGEPADGTRAVELAEQARMHIDRWFYPCAPSMHVALAEMYTTDVRFRAHYDDRRAGLADFVAAAIKANAATSPGA